MNESYARVAVAAAHYAFDKPYSYALSEKQAASAEVGMRVTVPFSAGNRPSEGIILEIYKNVHEKYACKPVTELLDDAPLIDSDMLSLAFWLRQRCFCALYDIIRAILPAGLGRTSTKGPNTKEESMICAAMSSDEAASLLPRKRDAREKQLAVLDLLAHGDAVSRYDACYYTGASVQTLRSMEKKGMISFYDEQVYRSPMKELLENAPEKTELNLSDEQNEVYLGLKQEYKSGKASCALLYGVTGSGKTHVYLKLIDDVLKDGKSAIALVPEISLTPQFVKRFYDVFGARIAVLHSGLSTGERCDEWRRIARGEADVVIGTRSAVFAPIPAAKLGVIVIDEEQEYSYKSSNSPRYHARDVAKYRAAKSNALLILGSATPSVESTYAARTGTYKAFSIVDRFGNAEMADVTVVDMRRELEAGLENAISRPLLKLIDETAEKGEQSILFINRRGRNRRLVCTECGNVPECKNCSSAMSYHAANNRLMCHICGYSEPMPLLCPACGSRHIVLDKAGTQKVEEELETALPGIKYLRMDADTTSSRNSHEKILEAFRNKEASVLIGTQMVTKGLDFENVTVAGVLDADMSLFMNDFRAAERTFSLITQVVGRSGRGKHAGRAVIQTISPQNPVLLAAAAQDYRAFYKAEIAMRRAMLLPPFCDLYVATLSGRSDGQALNAAIDFRDMLRAAKCGTVLGPAPASILKVQNRYRYRLTIRTKDCHEVRTAVDNCVARFVNEKRHPGVYIAMDINPYE